MSDQNIITDINRSYPSGISLGQPASNDPQPASLLKMYPPGFDPSQVVGSQQDPEGSSEYKGMAATSRYFMKDGSMWMLDRTGSVFKHFSSHVRSPKTRVGQYAIYQGSWLTANKDEQPIVNGEPIRHYKPGDPAFIGAPNSPNQQNNDINQANTPTNPLGINSKQNNDFNPLGGFDTGQKSK